VDPLRATLRRVRRRLRLVRALDGGLRVAVAAAGVAVGLVLVRILFLRPGTLLADQPAFPLLFVPAGFVLGYLVRLLAPVTLHDAARVADCAAGLEDRLATALEVLEAADPAVSPGLFDERLLAQAREAAARLDVARLPIPHRLAPQGRILLGTTLLVLIGAMIPALAGPPRGPEAASRTGATLEAALRRAAPLRPALRSEIERALARLQAAGATRGDAARATETLWRAAADADRRRREAARALGKVDQPQVRAMTRAAAAGDGAGASAAADSLADHLRAEPGAGGMPLSDREHLADALDGAAAEVSRGNPATLAEALRRAAAAVRHAEGTEARETLHALAETATAALGTEAAGGLRVLVAAAQDVRRDLGLPDLDEAALAGPTDSEPAVPLPPAATPAEGEEEGMGDAVSGGAAAPDVSPEVRPEDQESVRRYFGG